MIEFLDNLFRFSAVGILLWLVAMLVRDLQKQPIIIYAVLSACATAAYLLCSSQYGLGLFGPLAYPLAALCDLGSLFIWVFCLSLFDDRFHLTPAHYVFAVIFSALYVAGEFIGTDARYMQGDGTELALGYVQNSLRLLMALHIAFTAWRGRADDLIEQRRKYRLTLVIFITATWVWISTIDMGLFGGRPVADWLRLAQAAAILFVVASVAWRIGRLDLGALFMVRSKAPTPVHSMTPEDQINLDQLEALMADGLYRQAGLTIAGLAQTASMPEHRLRQLINKHLGFRNFSGYLNHYRITAAQERLSSVTERNIPVLTIAMDLGYGSLGPFNRAFKERTGSTPTEYRRQKLADS